MVEEHKDKTGWIATYMAGPFHVTNMTCVCIINQCITNPVNEPYLADLDCS